MIRKVSINWLKQQSGNFALKGITITEDNHFYDSSTSFREQDAEWLTTTLGAEPQIEMSRGNQDPRNSSAYPSWANIKSASTVVDDISPLTLERANSTLLRHFLSQLIEASRPSPGDADPELRKLLQDASATLRSSDCGTYYSVGEAIDILKRHQAAPPGRVAPLPKKA